MFPYFKLPRLGNDTFAVEPFGILVAIGVLTGAWLIQKVADEDGGYDFNHVQGLLAWTAISGFVVSHLFDVFAYTPEKITEDPLILVKVWAGISSFGGLLGCSTGFFYYLHKHGLKGKTRREYCDIVMVGGVVGFAIGRIGCTLVRDHPGAPTDFFLGFDFGGGNVRHNLGFYDLMWCIVIAITIFVVRAKWKNRPRGFISGLAPTMYATVRFFLDFLRTSKAQGGDERYLGLTPGHYMSLVMLALGVATLAYAFKHRDDPPPPYDPEADSDIQPVAVSPAAPKPKKARKKKKK